MPANAGLKLIQDFKMSNEIIVAEKKNGSGCFNKAFVCNDESDFISRIRETQCQHRSDKEMVETLDAAIQYNDETFGVSTLIVSRAEFDAGPVDSWDQAILDKAIDLGWYDPPTESE